MVVLCDNVVQNEEAIHLNYQRECGLKINVFMSQSGSRNYTYEYFTLKFTFAFCCVELFFFSNSKRLLHK